MTVRDLPQVLAIEQRCFKNPWNEKQYLYELQENPYACLWVMTDGDRVIGYYDLWLIFEQGELANIAIDTPYQHQGLGARLMKHMEDYARQKGLETIGLEVRVSNQAAISLYERNGFFTINVKPKYYDDEDGYRMMKGI